MLSGVEIMFLEFFENYMKTIWKQYIWLYIYVSFWMEFEKYHDF